MANEIVKKTGANAVKDLLGTNAMQQLFRQAIGKHADTFCSSVIELVSQDAALKNCEPKDVCLQALKAATLHLPLQKSLGNAYVVVYKNNGIPTPTFIIGYKGLIQLAIRTGEYKYINADVVYEGEYKGKNKLTGEVDLSGEKISDKVIGYFCYFELVKGFSKMLYMSVEDVAKYAKKFSKTLAKTSIEELISKAGREGQGVGWIANFDAMALKTCTRRLLSKYGALSVEMHEAVANDIAADVEQNAREIEAVEIREQEVEAVVTEDVTIDLSNEAEKSAAIADAEDDFIPFTE